MLITALLAGLTACWLMMLNFGIPLCIQRTVTAQYAQLVSKLRSTGLTKLVKLAHRQPHGM
jgi:hypothetical protein